MSVFAMGKGRCRSDADGECTWKGCPQLRDGEPRATGRHCPLDHDLDERHTKLTARQLEALRLLCNGGRKTAREVYASKSVLDALVNKGLAQDAGLKLVPGHRRIGNSYAQSYEPTEDGRAVAFPKRGA